MENKIKVHILKVVLVKYENKTADGYLCHDIIECSNDKIDMRSLFIYFPELMEFKPPGSPLHKPWFGHNKNPDAWAHRIVVLEKLIKQLS